jgi:hypothetical protein
VRDAAERIIDRFNAQDACAACMVLPKHPTYGICHGEFRFRIRGTEQALEEYRPYIGAKHDGAGERTIGMFSLYDQVLLFHCRCRSAFDRGRKFLNEQFADVLEFAYNDILDLTGGPDHAPAIALDPLPVTQAATSFGSGTDAPRPHHPGLKVLSPGELDQLLREQHRQTFNGFADCGNLRALASCKNGASRGTPGLTKRRSVSSNRDRGCSPSTNDTPTASKAVTSCSSFSAGCKSVAVTCRPCSTK